MFTGIIEEQGEVLDVAPSGDGARLTIRAPLAVSDATHGASIQVSGVCLTVVDFDAEGFTADVMRQTLDVTTLGALAPGTAVNIERAMSAGGRLGGHIVQGHVDATGTILDVRPGDRWSVVRVGIPRELAPVVVDKGSIAIDGACADEHGAHLRWFILSDAIRGQGLGLQLLDSAIGHVDARQYRQTHLWTFAGLDAARHLYEAVGFQLAHEASGDQWGTVVSEQRFERLLKAC